MGEAMAQHFLQEEANGSYCALTVTNTEFDEFDKSVPAKNSARAVGAALDVGDKQAVVEWVKISAKRLRRIDVVIANASPMHMEGETEHWQSSFAIDVMGFVDLVKAKIPYLEKSSQASIIVQSSFMGREFYRSPPAAYGPCKAAQLQHVQKLSHFLGPKKIRVNAISPGPILCKGGPWGKYSEIMPEWVEEQRSKVPLKRLGAPEEIEKVAVFLASPLDSFFTGANVFVNGRIHIGTQF
ncbi:short-chain dehydrogenase, putative [Talaromyces stipitatus ATCC 10500]|uniref:Short-chain dehydrogenase, putative n=1 Tax=Talaromyces stipitatus (strain ATCC 10500 / CBS 375.48 / QM 6759 / NRRL 1006) TaxID=441959 RepID=B8MC23_TALSN|nr:short-chain dehydrogenase, putative [Talaromyces stipitatus ATCC 10500]EED18469.1 short-chain dehydrogenase, putative [Talaromyces stipitatus ATCC 10500]